MMEAVCVCYPPMSLIINIFSVLINRNNVLYTQFMILYSFFILLIAFQKNHIHEFIQWT